MQMCSKLIHSNHAWLEAATIFLHIKLAIVIKPNKRMLSDGLMLSHAHRIASQYSDDIYRTGLIKPN